MPQKKQNIFFLIYNNVSHDFILYSRTLIAFIAPTEQILKHSAQYVQGDLQVSGVKYMSWEKFTTISCSLYVLASLFNPLDWKKPWSEVLLSAMRNTHLFSEVVWVWYKPIVVLLFSILTLSCCWITSRYIEQWGLVLSHRDKATSIHFRHTTLATISAFFAFEAIIGILSANILLYWKGIPLNDPGFSLLFDQYREIVAIIVILMWYYVAVHTLPRFFTRTFGVPLWVSELAICLGLMAIWFALIMLLLYLYLFIIRIGLFFILAPLNWQNSVDSFQNSPLRFLLAKRKVKDKGSPEVACDETNAYKPIRKILYESLPWVRKCDFVLFYYGLLFSLQGYILFRWMSEFLGL